MRIILYGINYAPELTGIGKYNSDMVTWLTEQGHQSTVITAPPYYPEWKVHDGYRQCWFNKSISSNVKIIRCPIFVPTKVRTITRLFHLLSFSFTSAFALFSQLFSKPNVLILVQPTFFCAPVALLFCWVTGTKSVLHIQDYELDAMLGLSSKKEKPVFSIVRKLERYLMSKFDTVSTISSSMMQRAESKGVEAIKIVYFPNWANTDFVTPDTDGGTLRASWGFTNEDTVILYSGNIGRKQGLELVIKAARHFQGKTDVKFVIVGSGAHLDRLLKLANSEGLSNITFKSLLPWAEVPQMLAMADIHLVVQKASIADAVLPSKLTNILSVGGHALVTAVEDSELGRIEANHQGIYTRIEPEDESALINGLNELLERDLSEYNSVARKYAEEFLNRDRVLSRFESDLESLISKYY